MDHDLYKEDPAVGNVFREQQKFQFDHLIHRLRQEAEEKRESFFKLDTSSAAAFEKEAAPMREQLKHMLGWPLTMGHESSFRDSAPAIPEAKVNFVSEDKLGRIYRVEVEVDYGLTTYGLLFLPSGDEPYPLVIAQHGGWGTPELCSGFYGASNYNDMTRRVLKLGAAVFAPQLLLWHPDSYGPEFHRNQYDNQLKQVGSSIAAVEIHKIRRAIDYLIARPDIDGSRIGMIGLSYGGFYTMFTAAVDTRIKAVYSSCFINNRFEVDWSDFTWFNAGNRFLDAEVCALIAPRFLYLEVGKRDDLFLYKHAQPEIDKVADLYKQLNLANRFASRAFDGGHELDPENEGIELFCSHLSLG
ncbi:dienelactone hydrolase family protein [Paenibacillus mendelii]|uniref:Dienelactone hydrolase family protein n=1 Tax=Paenibacillus mendelii TaxID=206163 RepID=A0ABV6J1V2_9BACL|nr:dienelactone hydrolase family protein [Paenibacillus mendelii]MCQ6562779.1 dienelactone hydrolase family protein [Paenibacillus mendelii]